MYAIAIAVAVAYPLRIQGDQKIQDDLIVTGSICSGFDCNSGETFNFDTLRLKENNLRINFIDTSSSSSFPSGDWLIEVNDSVNGGLNRFSIKDDTTSTTPFTIVQGAPDNSIYVTSAGNVGFGTSTPLVELVVKDGNSPTLRLEQDQSAGFAAQSWDVGGNETNFFIRDVTNNSQLPFRLSPGAPNSSLHIASDGDVGFETSTPDGQFDVAHSSDANNHAFIISPVSYVGVNIDNGYLPLGWFDVHTSGGDSKFLVNTAGNVGIGAGTSGAVNGRFEIKSLDSTKTYFNVDASGDIGIGTASLSDSNRFEIKSSDGNTSLLSLDTSGNMTIPGLLNGASPIATTMTFSNTGLSTTGQATNWDLVMSDSNGDFGIKPTAGSKNQLTVKSTGTMVLESGTDTSITLANTTITSKNSDATTWDVVMGDSNDQLVIKSSLNDGENLLTLTSDGDLIILGGLEDGSDRQRKENIESIDTAEILENLAAMPVSQWNFEGNDVTHIGPMAQDFWTSFKVGRGDTTISKVDADGVAIASIQELYKQLKEKDKELEDLREHNEELENRLQRIEELLLK